jgi:UDP-N-acetylglucosamine:LPS N-acetylglucosamine transferase
MMANREGGAKRVLILSADAGFGHKSSANAIAAALYALCDGSCDIKVVNALDEEDTPGLLRNSQSSYDLLLRRAPLIYKLGYELSDTGFARGAVGVGLRISLSRTMRKLVSGYKPDVVVSTYPLYSAALGAAYDAIGRRIPTIRVVTDFCLVHKVWFSGNAELTVVPSPEIRQFAIDSGLSADSVEVLGIPVNPRIMAIASKSKEELRSELGIDPSLPCALAIGSKRVRQLLPALEALNESGLPLQLIAVAGGDPELYDRLSSVRWRLPSKILSYVVNAEIPALMRASDCLISKAGGLILSEALASGLPTIIIEALPGQEAGNARYVVDRGAGSMARGPGELVSTLSGWLRDDSSLLKAKSRNAELVGRPDAAFAVSRRILEYASGAIPSHDGDVARYAETRSHNVP